MYLENFYFIAGCLKKQFKYVLYFLCFVYLVLILFMFSVEKDDYIK